MEAAKHPGMSRIPPHQEPLKIDGAQVEQPCSIPSVWSPARHQSACRDFESGDHTLLQFLKPLIT